MIQGDEEKIRFTWGVKFLPWLILTDKQHIVQADGFSINELAQYRPGGLNKPCICANKRLQIPLIGFIVINSACTCRTTQVQVFTFERIDK